MSERKALSITRNLYLEGELPFFYVRPPFRQQTFCIPKRLELYINFTMTAGGKDRKCPKERNGTLYHPTPLS